VLFFALDTSSLYNSNEVPALHCFLMTDEIEKRHDFDVLADVLDTLRFKGSMFFRSELAAPWGMRLDKCDYPRFHIVLSGSCCIGARDVENREISPKEIVLLAGGHEHWIADKPGRQLVASTKAAQACHLDQPLFQHGKITHRIMCGQVQYDQDSTHPFLDSLHEIMHFENTENQDSIWPIVTTIEAEINRTGQHDGPIMDRLAEILFIRLLDHCIGESKKASGFLKALSDRRVYNALALIHEEPGHAWTLNELGEKVGMSRSTLANWRLAKVYHQVIYTKNPLSQIADNFGYSSVGTMNRAFLRCYDITPAALRNSKSNRDDVCNSDVHSIQK